LGEGQVNPWEKYQQPSFDTTLTPGEETQFKTWKSRYAPNDSGMDYDLRGAFKAGIVPAGPEAGKDAGHFPDTFKKPSHPTFSDQSQYAKYGNPGRWDGDTFIPPASVKPWEKYGGTDTAPASPPTQTASLGEVALGTPLGSLALGGADLLLGPAQFGANVGSYLAKKLPGGDQYPDLGKMANEQMARLNAASERGRAAQGREGFDAWRMAGGLGTGTVASLGSKAIATGLPYATSYAGRVAQGLGLGTFFGGLSADQSTTPQTQEDYLKGQGVKAAVGGTVGTTIPAVISPVLRGAYNLAEPHLPGGINTMAARTLNQAAGPNKDEIIRELSKNHPMNTTAGQAAVPAGRAEFAGLQDKVTSRRPSDYLNMRKQADQSMVDSMQNYIAKTPDKLAAAEKARSAVADPLYQAARAGTTPVDTSHIIDHLDMVIEKNPGNRELVREFSNIRKGLVDDLHVKGLPAYAAQTGARTNAQEVSSVIDGMKKTLEHQDNKHIQGELLNVKKMLTQSIPGWQDADQAFAQASVPINKMEYGQALQQKLTSALEDKLTPMQFAQGRRNESGTISAAMGATPLKKESEFLHPREITVLDKIAEQLQRNAAYKEQAAAGAPAANQLVRDSLDPAHVPNFFMRSVMVAHHILDRLQGGAEKHTLDRLATVMQNPNATAKLMESSSPARQAMIKALAERGATTGAVIAAPKTVQ
jgi:hypothetical protein